MIYRSDGKRPHWILFVIAAVLIALTLRGYVGMIQDCEEYVRLYKNPLVVTAKVVAHDEKKDNEGESTYYSYISYTAQGKEYNRVRYQTTSFRRELKAVGTTFSLELNPENPRQRMDQVSSASYVGFLALALGCSVALLLHTLRRMGYTGDMEGTVEEETVRRDLLTWARCGYLRTAVVLTVLLRLPVQLGFPMLADGASVITTVVLIVLGVYLVWDTARNRRLVLQGEYRVSADMLAEQAKEELNWHKLKFSGSCGEWDVLLNEKEWGKLRLDAPFYSVWLSERSIPVLHYSPVRK